MSATAASDHFPREARRDGARLYLLALAADLGAGSLAVACVRRAARPPQTGAAGRTTLAISVS